MRRTAVALLVLALTGQFVWIHRRQAPVAFDGPVLGQPLANVDLRMDSGGSSDLRHLVDTRAGCTLLVIVSTGCPVCQRMRYTWPRRFAIWKDSIAPGVQPVWLAPQGIKEQSQFYDGFNYTGIRRGQLLGDSAGTILGVIGTPTLYLVDSEGRLRIGVMGDMLPPADSVAHACR